MLKGDPGGLGRATAQRAISFRLVRAFRLARAFRLPQGEPGQLAQVYIDAAVGDWERVGTGTAEKTGSAQMVRATEPEDEAAMS